MENIKISTTQNIDIESRIASIGERMIAHLFDYILIFAYFFIFGIILQFIPFSGYEYAILVIHYTPFVFYDLVFELILNGQSPGKVIMKIKVIKADGSNLHFGNIFIRWVFRLIENIAFMGSLAIITLIINGKGQRLGDIAAGTRVIRLRKKSTPLSGTVFRDIPENYEVTFPKVKLLDEKDIHIVNEVLNYLKKSDDSHYNIILGYNAKKKVESKTGIQSDKKPFDFLNTILMDYNYLNKE